MTIASAARIDWNRKEYTRQCDVCRAVVRVPCYPMTGINQHHARRETQRLLREHMSTHTEEELRNYVERIHQI